MRKGACVCLAVLFAAAGLTAVAGEGPTATPPELVAAYDSLADSIMSTKKTEVNLVHSILAMTYAHAHATLAEAKAMIEAGKDAGPALEKLAALVAQLGNEGDASVAAIRKRLVEAGHHHHSQAEKEGAYDEGFVVVTRAAKKAFLASAGNFGRMGGKPDAGALDAEWAKVKKLYMEVMKGA